MEAFLQSARHRIWTMQIARMALLGLVVASAVFLLCEISRAALAHFGFSGPLAAGSRLISVSVATAVLVLWIGVAALRIHLFAPNRLGLARLADRRFRLDERLSTALEVSVVAPATGLEALLAAAVADDARAHIRTLDPHALAPSRLSGWAVLIPVAITLGLLVPAGGAMLPPNPAIDAAATSRPDGAEKAEAAQPLLQMTELADPKVARSQSSYSALAPSTDALKTGMPSGAPSRQDITQALGRFAAPTPGGGGAAPGSMQQSDATGALSKEVLALQSPPSPPAIVDNTRPSQQDSTPLSRQPAQQRPKPPQPNVNNPEQAPVALKDAPAAHAGDGYDEAFSTFQQPQQSSANAQMTLTEQKQIEAAENAYSSGREAGDGTRPLGNGGDDGQLADLLSHDAGQLSLPQAMGTEGERISVKVAPPTATGPAASYSADRSDAWTGSPDQAVARRQPHAWERDILARYFRPDPDGQ